MLIIGVAAKAGPGLDISEPSPGLESDPALESDLGSEARTRPGGPD